MLAAMEETCWVSEGAAEFCGRVRPWLVGALSLYSGRADVAEELTQETLSRVWLRWDEVSQMASPEGWAYRVGINLANSHFRRRAAERRARRRLARQQSWVTADTRDRSEAIAVRRLVATLPARQRTALVLRYYADLSVADTAALMECAEGTVKALTSQAIASLRTRSGWVGGPAVEGVTDGG